MHPIPREEFSSPNSLIIDMETRGLAKLLAGTLTIDSSSITRRRGREAVDAMLHGEGGDTQIVEPALPTQPRIVEQVIEQHQVSAETGEISSSGGQRKPRWSPSRHKRR